MTFEARDSAAKVVPARFKLSTNSRANGTRMNSSRRATGKIISNLKTNKKRSKPKSKQTLLKPLKFNEQI